MAEFNDKGSSPTFSQWTIAVLLAILFNVVICVVFL